MTLRRRVRDANAKRGRVCLGIDPRPADVPKGWVVGDYLDTLIEVCAPHVAAVKPNLAFFLAHGDSGTWMLKEVVRRARRSGLLTVLDGKFADVPDTTEHYASFAFEHLGVEAVTANPYLGPDAVLPFLSRGGCFVLARTTNKGAGLVQDLGTPHGPLFEHVAALFSTHENAGLVAPGNEPSLLQGVRSLVGADVPLLVPGVGAQGGDPAKVRAAAGDGPILVSASRSISGAKGKFPDAQVKAAEQLSKSLS